MTGGVEKRSGFSKFLGQRNFNSHINTSRNSFLMLCPTHPESNDTENTSRYVNVPSNPLFHHPKMPLVTQCAVETHTTSFRSSLNPLAPSYEYYDVSYEPMQQPLSWIHTQTLHVAYNPRITDRGSLFLHFRNIPGFDLIAFYDRFCFVRFKDPQSAARGLKNPFIPGMTANDPAKQYYEVPYPQPEDDARFPCQVLHITHLPSLYTRTELEKIFGLFEGFVEAHFYGKYGYVYFQSEQKASVARRVLRAETNLVVSFAKNAPKPTSFLTQDMPHLNSSTGMHTLHQDVYMGDAWPDNKPPKVSIFNHARFMVHTTTFSQASEMIHSAPTEKYPSSYTFENDFSRCTHKKEPTDLSFERVVGAGRQRSSVIANAFGTSTAFSMIKEQVQSMLTAESDFSTHRQDIALGHTHAPSWGYDCWHPFLSVSNFEIKQ